MNFASYLLMSLEERSADLRSLLLPSRGQEPESLVRESGDNSPGTLLVWVEGHGLPCLDHILLLDGNAGVSWYVWLPALDWMTKDPGAFLPSLATGCRKGVVRSSTGRGNIGEKRGPPVPPHVGW